MSKFNFVIDKIIIWAASLVTKSEKCREIIISFPPRAEKPTDKE